MLRKCLVLEAFALFGKSTSEFCRIYLCYLSIALTTKLTSFSQIDTQSGNLTDINLEMKEGS